MKSAIPIAVLVGIVMGACALFRMLFYVMSVAAAHRSDIVVGSKAFGESIVLGEIISQSIERETGLHVTRRFDLGGTQFCFEALRAGEIDLYPEYTGTAYAAILHDGRVDDPARVLPTVRAQLAQRYGMEIGAPMGFDNTYALAVPRRLAIRLGLRTIGDLRARPELRAGFATEFAAREDGWPGLARAYALHFDEAPRTMEAALMYRAADANQVDVISAYSTDGRIASMDLVLLVDDLHFFPPYEPVAILRTATLRAHPNLRTVLERLRGTITDARMRTMNADVDSGRRSPEQIGAEFLQTLAAAR